MKCGYGESGFCCNSSCDEKALFLMVIIALAPGGSFRPGHTFSTGDVLYRHTLSIDSARPSACCMLLLEIAEKLLRCCYIERKAGFDFSVPAVEGFGL